MPLIASRAGPGIYEGQIQMDFEPSIHVQMQS